MDDTKNVEHAQQTEAEFTKMETNLAGIMIHMLKYCDNIRSRNNPRAAESIQAFTIKAVTDIALETGTSADRVQQAIKKIIKDGQKPHLYKGVEIIQ